MRYAFRLGILFAFVLFSARVSANIEIGNHWYFFFWAFFVAALNAGLRTFFNAFSAQCTWGKVIIGAVLLNWFLYSLIFWGAFEWIELTSLNYGPVLLGAFVVMIPSSICNHFIRKRKS